MDGYIIYDQCAKVKNSNGWMANSKKLPVIYEMAGGDCW